jgi:hypothetical protein
MFRSDALKDIWSRLVEAFSGVARKLLAFLIFIVPVRIEAAVRDSCLFQVADFRSFG